MVVPSACHATRGCQCARSAAPRRAADAHCRPTSEAQPVFFFNLSQYNCGYRIIIILRKKRPLLKVDRTCSETRMHSHRLGHLPSVQVGKKKIYEKYRNVHTVKPSNKTTSLQRCCVVIYVSWIFCRPSAHTAGKHHPKYQLFQSQQHR